MERETWYVNCGMLARSMVSSLEFTVRADSHASCYGDSPAYNQFFIKQLTELLTNYGEVHEVWFDGANGEGPNGKKQIYDWDAILKTIRRLQPKAVTAIMGDDSNT